MIRNKPYAKLRRKIRHNNRVLKICKAIIKESNKTIKECDDIISICKRITGCNDADLDAMRLDFKTIIK